MSSAPDRSFVSAGAAWPARAAVSLLLLMAAFGLKLAYSRAGADALGWVLAPSCWFASQLGGVQLVHEAGAGWISHQPRMVVGPACAGVNFLVVAWLALFFSLAREPGLAGMRRQLAWAAGSLLAAYLATLASNGLRIVLAAQFYGAHFQLGWLTPERLHRLLGIVVYCSALLGLCRVAELCVSGAARGRMAPFYWYVAVAIGVPLANRAFLHDPARFAEHALLTLGMGLVVAGFWRLIGRLVVRLSSRAAGL
jgi:exosortase K